MHITLRWTVCALAAAGLLTLAACGDSDDDVTTQPAAPSVADVSGSDQHLTNMAEQANPGYVYSGGEADSLGQQAADDSALAVRAGNAAAEWANAERYVDQLEARAAEAAELTAEQAQADAEREAWARLDDVTEAQNAEEIERQAHLDGQARTYGG